MNQCKWEVSVVGNSQKHQLRQLDDPALGLEKLAHHLGPRKRDGGKVGVCLTAEVELALSDDGGRLLVEYVTSHEAANLYETFCYMRVR